MHGIYRGKGSGGDAAKNAGLLYTRMVLCSFATLAQFALPLNSEVNVNHFESHHIVLAASTYFIASNPVLLLPWLMAITITYRPMATLVSTVDGGKYVEHKMIENMHNKRSTEIQILVRGRKRQTEASKSQLTTKAVSELDKKRKIGCCSEMIK